MLYCSYNNDNILTNKINVSTEKTTSIPLSSTGRLRPMTTVPVPRDLVGRWVRIKAVLELHRPWISLPLSIVQFSKPFLLLNINNQNSMVLCNHPSNSVKEKERIRNPKKWQTSGQLIYLSLQPVPDFLGRGWPSLVGGGQRSGRYLIRVQWLGLSWETMQWDLRDNLGIRKLIVYCLDFDNC